MVHESPGRWMDDLLPAAGPVAAWQGDREHQGRTLAAKIPGGDPRPGKTAPTSERDLTPGGPDAGGSNIQDEFLYSIEQRSRGRVPGEEPGNRH
jgi:hypothetical protein